MTNKLTKVMTRRQLLKAAALGISAAAIAGCTPPATPAPTLAAAATATAVPPTKAPEPTKAPTTAPTAAPTKAPEPTKAAPSPTATQLPAAKGNRLVIAVAQEPGLVSRFFNSQGGGWVSFLAQEPFIDNNIKGEPIPVLAAEVPSLENGAISKDFLTIKYKLKPNLKWSDGKPVTADDLIFTQEAYKASQVAPNVNNAHRLMDTVKKVDDLTVEVKYKELSIDYLNAFVWILPKHKFDSPAIPKDHPETRLPTGTGPFVFKSWKAGDEIIAEKNPNYRVAGKPAIEAVTIKFTPDRNTMLAALANGQLDYIHFVTASDMVVLDKAKKEGKINFETNPGPTQIEGLWLNQSTNGDIKKPHPVLSDKAIREAMDYAINRKEIIDTVLGGFAVAVSSHVPAGWAALDRPMTPFDPKKANDILEAAGWKKGTGGIREKGGVKASVKCTTPTGDNTRALYQQLIQQYLKDVGIEMIIDNKPNTNIFGGWQGNGMLARGTYDIIMSRSGGGVDPHGWLMNFTTENIPSDANPGGSTFGHYSNPKFDDLVKKGGSTLDMAERKKYYNEATKLLADERISILLYANIRGVAYSKRLSGVKINWWRLESCALQDIADWVITA